MTESIRRRALLDALLGPGESEVTCEECFDLLDRYVDLADAADDDADRAVPGMLAHLAGCPACREDHESLRDLVRADAELGTNSID
ncbi:MAG: hypothetical protein QOH12_3288 [Solirubrobacteraceae bacterium]|jgi:hypothetical protein|nr:hypothetical protein [Solirubrobacteraceae bacterium]